MPSKRFPCPRLRGESRVGAAKAPPSPKGGGEAKRVDQAQRDQGWRHRRAKLPPVRLKATHRRKLKRRAAHTLTELMASMAVFSLAMIGVMACHLAGLRMNVMILPKLQNAQYSRQALSHLIEEVRCASSIQVGSGTLTTFAPAGATNQQVGNALRIYPSTNTTQFIYYFHDPSALVLNKVSFSGTNVMTVATAVTNDSIFAVQDYSGSVLTNNQNNAVVSVLLQMSRTLPISGLVDTYEVGTKITRRSLF